MNEKSIEAKLARMSAPAPDPEARLARQARGARGVRARARANQDSRDDFRVRLQRFVGRATSLP